MTRRALCLVLTGLVLTGAASATAAEPYQEFIDGLRERRYYDYALLYLEQIEADPKTPAEIRQVVPFEKAITLLQQSRIVRNPDQQTQLLDRAEAFLEQFAKAQPGHSRAGQANSERAQILLGKARVAVFQSKSPANEGRRPELQNQARELIARARTIFQDAHDQHKATYETFPTFIERERDKDQYEARAQAEIRYIRAQLDLALCTYEEAQTYDAKAPEYKNLLTKASLEFEKIHERYRSMVGGLYARMWQGKCFEEQDDIRKALGIYDELLRHPGTSQAMRTLQEQVLQFRLICLNHEQRKDYQLVIDQSSEWLNPTANRMRTRTPVGLGIRWERARANEQMSLRREISKQDRDRYLRAALADARQINQFDGQYKDVSLFMIQRLEVALGREAGDPRDFNGAIGLARGLVKEIKGFTDAIAAAKRANEPKEKIDELEQDLQHHLNETGRILKLALTLADEQTELVQKNTARYLLSYIYFLSKQSYEAAVLGEFVGSRFQNEEDHGQLALDAAHIALAAWQQAYYADPRREDREFEMNQLERVCTLITTRWPQSDKANEARMMLGRLYGQKKQPADAARWYSEIPETALQFSDAQIAAGQSYWTAYLEAAPLPDEEKPPVEELQKWQDSAEQHLETGIARLQSEVPESGTPADELIAAKVSLAQIKINKGQYPQAIELITGDPADPKGERDPHPVDQHIKVADETQRPRRGIKSREFAGLTYQLLLRAYVGTQQIDKALDAMNALEEVAGGAEGEGVMQVYVQLGRELQKEIERLKGLGQDEQLTEVRTSFDRFLNELFQRKETMKYNALIWIGETYYGLAQGMSGDAQASEDYFRKAAQTYEDIIGRGAREPGFVPDGRLTGVKLRLVNCKRRQKDFKTALELAGEILKELPNALDAQFEAAYVLQDWAASGQGDSYQKYLEAINGPADGPFKDTIWGWGRAAFLLQRILDAGQARGDQEEKYLEARYNSSWCRSQYAKAQTSTPKRNEELEKTKSEIEAFVAVSGDVSDSWWKKFDTLYRDIQQEMGLDAVALARPEVFVAQAAPPGTSDDNQASGPAAASTPGPSIPPSEPNYLLFLLAVVGGVAAVGGGTWFMMHSPKKRRRSYATAGAPAAAAAKRPAARTAAAPSAGQPTKKRPAAGASAESAAAPAKPKPKPTKPRPPA